MFLLVSLLGRKYRERQPEVGRYWRTGTLAALVALAGLPAVLPAAQAQQASLFANPAPPRPDPDGEYGEGLAPFEADGPMVAVVSLASQRIRVFDRNGEVASSKVSTGRKGFETPEGIFSIIERKVEHNSNLYDDAEMPFMQRITWSGVALHQGMVPNYRASHGCIRLPSGFAERLFRSTRIATRVVIVPHEATPLPISHPALFQPGQPDLPVPETKSPTPERLPQSQPDSGDVFEPAPMMLGVRPVPPLAASEAVSPAPTKPGPTVAELRSRRIAAERRLAVATKAANAARPGLRPLLVEQGRAEKALRQAAALANRVDGRAAVLAKAVAVATGERDESSAINAHIDALIEFAEARGREEGAREIAARKTAAAVTVQAQVRKLEDERQAAQNEVRAIARKLSPVTIFVSRQTGRVYVRQAFHPVMEAPVAIKDPEEPLGTHVFSALEAEEDDGASVKWLGLTVETPGGGVPVAPEPSLTSGKRKAQAPKPAAPAARQDPLHAARIALDRIELPQAVLARVGPSLQPGSTLIISDLPQSIETGPGTDIVVQTRGEEQAAQNIANYVARKKAEALGQLDVSFAPSRLRGNGFRSGDWTRW